MANDFETNLILRGRDLASQPIEQLIATVKKLGAAVDDQTKAADAGAGSFGALNAASQEANIGLKALISVQGDVEKLFAALKKAEEAAAPVERAKAAYDAFKATLDTAEAPTKKQEKALNDLGKEVDKAARTLRTAEQNVTRLSEKLAPTGINAQNAAQQMAVLGNATQLLGGKLDQVANSFGNFSTNQARARAAAAEATKAEQEQARALQALDAQLAAIHAAEAKRDAEDHAALDRHIADLAKQNELLEREAEARAKGVTQQQAAASNALGAVPALSPVGAGTASPQFNDVAQGLANILNPAAQARATLAGVEEEIKRLDAEFAKGKLSRQEYAQGLQSARAAAEALGMQAGKIDGYQAQAAAVARAQAEFEREKVTLESLAGSLSRTATVDKALEAQVKAQSATVQRAAEVFERENNALTTLGAGLTRAGINSANLATEQARLQGAATELSAVMAKLSKAEGGNAGGLFNFNSPEVREAVGTVRHLADQIGNGASVTQALESHIGNFVQLGIQRLPLLIPILGYVVVALSAVVVAGAAMVRAFEISEATRKFQAQLDQSVDHLNTTGRAMAGVAAQIEHLGVSFAEAQAAVHTFIDAGLDPSRMLEFAEVSEKLARIHGTTLTEEVKKSTAAFEGGAKALIEYLIQEHALTPAIEEEIRAAQNANDTNKEREIAFRALADSVEHAHNVTSPFTTATIALSGAWHDFLDYLGPAVSAVGGVVIAALAGMLSGVNVLIGGLRDAVGLGATAAEDAAKTNIAAVQREITNTQQAIDGDPEHADLLGLRLAKQQAILAELQKQKVATDAQAESNKTLITQTTTRNAQAEEFIRKLQIQTDLERVRQERGPAALEAEERLLAAKRKELEDEAEGPGKASLNDPKVREQIDAAVARERQRLDLQRNSRPDVDAQLNLSIAENNARGLKGAAGLDADRRVNELKVEAERAKLIKDGTYATDAERERKLAELKQSLDAESARKRAAEGAGAAAKVQAAEDGLAKELLSIKQKLDGQDKTDLAARLRGIDEEFAKYQLKLDEAKRKGATSIPGIGGLDAFQSELNAAKQREIDSATLDSSLASIKAREDAAKAALAGVGELARKGGDSMAAAVQKALDVTGRLGPAIKAAGQTALDTAQRINDAHPTAKSAQAVETAAAAADGGDLVAKAAGELEAPGLKAAKDRDELIAAERKLEADGAQSSSVTQDKIKRAYDLTTDAIKASVKATQDFLDASLKAGTITPQQYELMSAKAQDLAAQTKYQSDQDKQLGQAIESSIQGQAVKAFDSATAALGKFIAGHEKLKDLVKSVALSFGEFAAGVLKDIANIIIKQEIMNALGFGGKKGSGSGDGGNSNSGGGLLDRLFGGNSGGSAKDGSTTGSSGFAQNGDVGGGDSVSSATNDTVGSSGGSSGSFGDVLSGAGGVARAAGSSSGGGILDTVSKLFGAVSKIPGVSDALGSFSGGESGGLLGSIGGLFGGPGNAGAAAFNALPAGVAGPVLGTAGDAVASTAGVASAASATTGVAGAAAEGGGSFLSSIIPFVLSLFAHEGGVVGSGAIPTRRVSLAAFMNAPRYHQGGMVGIKPDEQPAILQKGEHVLTAAQAANMNKPGGGSSPVNIRQVLVQDPQQISQAMNGSHGEQVVLSHIKNNAAAVRSIVSG